MSDELKSRLRSVGGVRHDGATRWYINPDGPEAADRIEKLEAQLAQSQFIRWAARFEEQADRIEKLEADLEVATMKRLLDTERIEKLEAALKIIGDLDIPRPVAVSYRDDGQPSKHDRCPHGGWMYDECADCVADFARKALGADD